MIPAIDMLLHREFPDGQVKAIHPITKDYNVIVGNTKKTLKDVISEQKKYNKKIKIATDFLDKNDKNIILKVSVDNKNIDTINNMLSLKSGDNIKITTDEDNQIKISADNSEIKERVDDLTERVDNIVIESGGLIWGEI